jgi:hypothetical protein
MAGGSNGYRAALVRRQLTPGLISSLFGTAGLPPFISFSTSSSELDSAVRRPMYRVPAREDRAWDGSSGHGRQLERFV